MPNVITQFFKDNVTVYKKNRNKSLTVPYCLVQKMSKPNPTAPKDVSQVPLSTETTAVSKVRTLVSFFEGATPVPLTSHDGKQII